MRVGEFNIIPMPACRLSLTPGPGFWINLAEGPREGEGMWVPEADLSALIREFYQKNF